MVKYQASNNKEKIFVTNKKKRIEMFKIIFLIPLFLATGSGSKNPLNLDPIRIRIHNPGGKECMGDSGIDGYQHIELANFGPVGFYETPILTAY
jgi:hypothetical protein